MELSNIVLLMSSVDFKTTSTDIRIEIASKELQEKIKELTLFTGVPLSEEVTVAAKAIVAVVVEVRDKLYNEWMEEQNFPKTITDMFNVPTPFKLYAHLDIPFFLHLEVFEYLNNINIGVASPIVSNDTLCGFVSSNEL